MSRRVSVRVEVRVGGGESEGSGSESERSGWVIMKHLVQIAQKKNRRDGDTNKNSGPDRSTSGLASINSGVLYPATSEQEHVCTMARGWKTFQPSVARQVGCPSPLSCTPSVCQNQTGDGESICNVPSGRVLAIRPLAHLTCPKV